MLAGVLFLASPRKSSQKEGDPEGGAGLCPVPCATRQAGRLRNSGLRPSNSPRRRPPAFLRCSAPSTGAPKAFGLHGCSSKKPVSTVNRKKRPKMKSVIQAPSPSMDRFTGPLERCRATQGLAEKGRGLSEGEARVPQPPPVPSSAGNRRSRHRPRVAFFLLTFSWRSKKK